MSRCGISSAFAAMLLGLWSVASAAAHAAVPFRALTYNVWGLPEPLIRDPQRIDEIARELPELGADVVAIQEAFHPKSDALAGLPAFPFVARGPYPEGTRQGSGLLILSRHRIVYGDRIAFDLCWEADCLARKGVLYARLRVPGLGEVDVFDTHLQAGSAAWVRDSQIEQAIRFIRRYLTPERPALFLGDFNSSPDSFPIRRVQQALALRDVHAEYALAHPELDAVSRDGFTDDPSRNRNLQGDSYPPQRIDFVWVRGSVSGEPRVASSRLLFERDWLATGAPLSDHFGVEAELEFPEPR